MTQAFQLGIYQLWQKHLLPDAVWNETVESGRISKQSFLELHQMQRHTLVQNEVTNFLKQQNI